MSSLPSLSAIILAGGQSRRMGQDKALLSIKNGQSLLANTAQVAQQLTSEVLVVTPWPERYQTLLASPLQLVTEVVTSKDVNTHGPLNGFRQGWQQVKTDWCLLLACDLPYLDASVLRAWWHWIGAQSPLPQLSLSPGKKGWEPLCGYYHRSCLPLLQQYLAKPLSPTGRSPSFQDWLATLPVKAYPLLPSTMLFNCNTPLDWAIVTQAQP